MIGFVNELSTFETALLLSSITAVAKNNTRASHCSGILWTICFKASHHVQLTCNNLWGFVWVNVWNTSHAYNLQKFERNKHMLLASSFKYEGNSEHAFDAYKYAQKDRHNPEKQEGERELCSSVIPEYLLLFHHYNSVITGKSHQIF